MQKINLLECTLRDGSYRVNYQFSAEDTAIIASGLENAGFDLIEIGHGLGLGASLSGEGVAAATDRAYLKAAASVLKKAKFGMFFIPGIGNEEDLTRAADCGMGFVRIGTNAPEVAKAESYIKLAKKLNLVVSVNLMKSYAVKPSELAQHALTTQEWGADIVYVVDSAGGMLPKEVSEYVKQIIDNVDIAVGFHGHNNFDLAIANTLAAVENGATYVDCTLQGMGRSAGNAPTEILVMVLEKMGYKTGVEPLKAMNIGESYVKPMMKHAGVSSINVIEGYALFHSKFMDNAYKIAEQFNIDPRELIMNVSKTSVIDVPTELLISAARGLAKSRKRKNTVISKLYTEDDEAASAIANSASLTELAAKIGKTLLSISKKNGKTSVFTLASSIGIKASGVSPFIRESELFVIGNSIVKTRADLEGIIREVDGIVDIILVDDEKKNDSINVMYETVKSLAKTSHVHSYADESLLARICGITIFQIAKGVAGKKIAIFGADNLGSKLSLDLTERGANVILYDSNIEKLKAIVKGLNLMKSTYAPVLIATDNESEAARNANVLIGTSHSKPTITLGMVKLMCKNGFVFDAGVGSVYQDAFEYMQKKSISIYRPDMKAGLSGEVLSIIETDFQLKSVLGKTKFDGVPVIAGGLLGQKGEVIVDSTSNPTAILGVADGTGGFIEDVTPYLDRIKTVKCAIIRRRVSRSLERTQRL